MSQICNAGRQNVLRLVLHSLQHPSPNLAHFLMGYELRKPVSKTNLQDPGKNAIHFCKRVNRRSLVKWFFHPERIFEVFGSLLSLPVFKVLHGLCW